MTALGPPEIAALREALDFTVTDLARTLNVGVQTVLRWESGETPVRMHYAVLWPIHCVVLDMRARGQADCAKALGARLRMGLGAFLHQELMRLIDRP